MPHDQSLSLEIGRFRLREVEAEDLEDIYAVFESNPEFLALREDVAALSGGYDRAAVKSYWEGAMLEPQRHLLLVAEAESKVTVGLVDFVDQSPADGMPWIGLVIVHRAHQRCGVGSAALRAVATYLATWGHPAVRMAVIEANDAGLAFARSSGFKDFASASVLTKTGIRQALLLELALSVPSSDH